MQNPVLLLFLSLAFTTQALAGPAPIQDFSVHIPPQKITFNVQGRLLEIIASGLISIHSRSGKQYVLSLELDADLADFQQNLTALLRPELDKSEACGENIYIEHATLMPENPSARAEVQLHYERDACIKALGRRIRERLVGGNGVIQIKFTPDVQDRKTLRLVPEVESINANGSLGELLRSGSIGAMVRRKITRALLSAVEKGTDRSITLPPTIQDTAAIDTARFEDDGGGRLGVVLKGEVTISPQQIQTMKKQLESHASIHRGDF